MPPLSQWRQRRIERLEELASAVGELFKGAVEVSQAVMVRQGQPGSTRRPVRKVELCHGGRGGGPAAGRAPARVGERPRARPISCAAIARARDLLDESGGLPAAVALADAFDDLDAYCESCDDEGLRRAGPQRLLVDVRSRGRRRRALRPRRARVIATQRADRRAAERAADEVPC